MIQFTMDGEPIDIYNTDELRDKMYKKGEAEIAKRLADKLAAIEGLDKYQIGIDVKMETGKILFSSPDSIPEHLVQQMKEIVNQFSKA